VNIYRNNTFGCIPGNKIIDHAFISVDFQALFWSKTATDESRDSGSPLNVD
jgi:hypothetical protein